MNDRLQVTILKSLASNMEYAKQTLPFLKQDYFSDQFERLVFGLINDFIQKYHSQPTLEALFIELNAKSVDENLFSGSAKLLVTMKKSDESSPDSVWLVEQTEKFCQEMAVHNAILSAINIIDGADKNKKDVGTIPLLLQEALSVSFDKHVGHDYLEDFSDRFDFYNSKEQKTPFDITLLNQITDGGLSNKTLNVLMAGVGVGKTLVMCHMAAANLMQNRSVLYITLEMAEERISERIDANLMGIKLNMLKGMKKKEYTRRMGKISETTKGKLIVKEYPTTSAGVIHFNHLLSELKLKRSFVPDIIYIDYINICTSSRFKLGNAINSYTYIKSIAEEIRGLAVEQELPIVSATQFNREGSTDTDAGMEKVAESWGLPATVDLMLALISTEQLEEAGQLLIKQLKNRYNDLATHRRFLVGIDRARMKLFNLGSDAQSAMGKQVRQNLVKNSPQSVFAETFTKSKNSREERTGTRSPRDVASLFDE